ncbi:MAG: 4-hydroxy-tetrahydrodipicolinate synthase [Desulfobacteraceae bacterium]|nr:MAG: 4-hydroxy-tetrahydrodipicolinate synthase [Desulfobacteraceae bacterium]
MRAGSYTAIITPFTQTSVDYDGLAQLVNFQIKNGITGILAMGTTGESPTLTWAEHNRVIQEVSENSKNHCLCIAGTGSNNTNEALAATEQAIRAGVDAVLLVDPYYNGPSSLEIRKEYVEPVAKTFPSTDIIPYVIPGRTGAQLLPEDLAILAETCPNVRAVKEATGNLENMKRTRKCCGKDYTILSGDDGMTFDMMTDPEIKATGVISVISNIAPKAVGDMVNLLIEGRFAEAEKYHTALLPLFDLVTVKTKEQTPYGEAFCRARNPLAVKTLMNILGMPSGPCRRPMGKMTRSGIEQVLSAVRQVQSGNPEILAPAAEFFNIDIAARIHDPKNWESLFYKTY